MYHPPEVVENKAPSGTVVHVEQKTGGSASVCDESPKSPVENRVPDTRADVIPEPGDLGEIAKDETVPEFDEAELADEDIDVEEVEGEL